MRSRGARLAVLGVAVAAVVAGCAGIPTSGPVHEAGQLNGVGDEPFSRIVAQGPAEGATPNAIVTGFLAASASFDDDHVVARSFLTPDAARSWRPGSRVQVYQQVTGSSGPFAPLGKDAYHFSAPLAGTLDSQGAYTGAPDGVSVNETFTLDQVGGQWRIAKLPQGLLLTTFALSSAYRAYDIYFPDPSRTVLVPDEVLVPVGPGPVHLPRAGGAGGPDPVARQGRADRGPHRYPAGRRLGPGDRRRRAGRPDRAGGRGVARRGAGHVRPAGLDAAPARRRQLACGSPWTASRSRSRAPGTSRTSTRGRASTPTAACPTPRRTSSSRARVR